MKEFFARRFRERHFATKSELKRAKRRFWNGLIKLWWDRLWIRKDEFHPSLNFDADAAMEMTPEEFRKYDRDLLRRRTIADRRNDPD